jgi:hypothetical protein
VGKHSKKNLFFLMAVAIAMTGLGVAVNKAKAQSQSTVGCPHCSVSSSIRPIICNQRSERSTFLLNTQRYALEARQCAEYSLPIDSTFRTSFGRGERRRTIEVTLEQVTYDFGATPDGSALELRRR